MFKAVLHYEKEAGLYENIKDRLSLHVLITACSYNYYLLHRISQTRAIPRE